MSDPANIKIYFAVLAVLLVGTLLTVGVSYIDLGTAGNIVLGLIIACAKASAVVLFFMHLKYEKRWWLGMVIFPIILVAIIIFSNFPDTAQNMAPEEKFGSGLTTPALKVIPGTGASEAH